MGTQDTASGAVSAAPFFDASPVPTFVHDPETGEILDVNEACEDLFGYDVETLRRMEVAEFSPSVEDATERAAAAFEEAMDTGGSEFDWEITRPDGSRAQVHVKMRPASIDGSVRLLAFVTDVTEQRKRERVLDELQHVATDLMNADSRAEIADITTGAAEDAIDFAMAGVRLLEGERLEMASMTADTAELLMEDPPAYAVGEGFVGEAFAAGETRVVDDLSTAETKADYGRIRSAVCVPLGRHGVFSVGSEDEGEFGPTEVEFARLLTRLTTAALDQYDRKERLRERTNQLETLLNNAPLVFYELDPEGTIVESRGKALERIGLEPGEAVGTSIFEMYADVPAVQQAVSQALDGERVSSVVNVAGQWFDNTFQPVFDDDGDLERVIGVAFDVTDQKTVERQFAALGESAIDLSEVDSAEAAVDTALGIAERVLGESLVVYWEAEDDRLVGSAVSDSADAMTGDAGGDLVHEAGDPVWNAFQRGETVVDNDFEPEQAATEGALRSVVLSPVGDHGLLTVGSAEPEAFDDQNRHLVSILTGLLRTTLDRLAYERDLENSRQELERSNESLQQFAYVASHDLQEPLRMVSSYVSLLESEYAEEFDDDAERYMAYATDGARRMQEMIDALLQYSRVHSKGEDFTDVDAEAVFDETLRSLEVLVEESGATVHREGLPPARADRSQLGQLFQNLVKNAVHHGGEAPTVTVDGWTDGDRVHYTVADDGPGIPESQHDRIFEIFKQDSERSESTGIGLAMCRRIVDRHGGDVWVESEPGEGATFHFTMPRAGDTARDSESDRTSDHTNEADT